MMNLFDAAKANEVKARLARLSPDSQRQWGKMSPGQAMAHCVRSMESAVGNTRPPRMFIGRIVGGMVKSRVVANDEPIRRNAPTAPDLVIRGERDLGAERERLTGLIDRFATGGATGCTTHPHSFFGRMAPEEWAILMYKHLDHHLRQFGV
jgi:hypothetical protein